MKQIDFNTLDVLRMNAHSLVMSNKDGEYFVHRRVFNAIKDNPELPVFVIERKLNGGSIGVLWLAVPLTMLSPLA